MHYIIFIFFLKAMNLWFNLSIIYQKKKFNIYYILAFNSVYSYTI